jgi:TetR/AcrR family transcriptional regulator
MLAAHAEAADFARPESFHSWRKTFTDKEAVLLTNLFEKGIKTGELKEHDARQTADLLLETLYAFSSCMREKAAIPDTQSFRELLDKQQQVIRVFYHGLKAGTISNQLSNKHLNNNEKISTK